MSSRLRVLTSSMYAFFERTLSWHELLGAELIEVPLLASAQTAFWDSIRQLYARALAGNDDDLLAKTTAGLLHPATFGALKAAGMSVDEASTLVGEMLARRARGQAR